MTRQEAVHYLNDDSAIACLREDLHQWWSLSGRRDFPWRETDDPYKILVAETLLHRTRAEQTVPLYRLFLNRFPDINAIVRSSPEELEALLFSLGLHWRWRLLHSMAVDIETRFNGQIPRGFEELTSLPGVSHYIASAVRCFAFGCPDVVLDTNTVRVTGRLLNLRITDSARRSRLFRRMLERYMDPTRPREFNLAMLDLAALICRPKSPIHKECPAKRYCAYYQHADSAGRIAEKDES